MKRLKKAYESAPAWAFGPCGPCIFRFSSDWVRDRVRYGHVSLDCFPSLRTINMYPMLFVKKKRTSSRFATTTLGAPPPLILGFHPSKRHAALIASCDQGSIVLAFTLVLLILKHFWWRVTSGMSIGLWHFRFAFLWPGINGSDCPWSKSTIFAAIG